MNSMKSFGLQHHLGTSQRPNPAMSSFSIFRVDEIRAASRVVQTGWLILAMLIGLLSVPLRADDVKPPKSWPNWMGPNWDGISRESGWKSEWPENGLPQAWTREIGIGFSSISISDGRLFTMGHIDGEEIVWCLNEKTGDVIWTHRYPCDLIANLHEGGPGATPTVDGARVYTVGKEGQLFCLNVETGKVVWDVLLRKDLDVPLPDWGFSGSPVITGKHLILEAGRVVSYDKLTGKKVWQTGTHEAGYGSAVTFPAGEAPSMIATLDCECLRITQLETGDEIATHPWKSPFRTNATTPIVSGERIFTSSAYNVGCAVFELDGRTLKEVYANREMRNHFNNCILFEGYLYGFDGNSNFGRVVQLTCMNFETGKVAWKQRGLGCGSLMVADGKLLILSETGELILSKASPAGFEELARSTFLDGRCWTVPVLFQNRIYGRNATGKLVAADLPR